jgi:dihydroorotate dehydrogenase (NAD+) catalytic subunit
MTDFTPDLGVEIAGVYLKNPVMTASGTFGYGEEFNDLIDLNRLGAIVSKGLSLEPVRGNPPPRTVETPCGMLNAIGLENVGLKAFINEKLPFLKNLKTPTFVNIWGTTEEEYFEMARRIDDIDGIAGIEVNISCPNIKCGGIAFGVDPDTAHNLIKVIREETDLPLLVKLSPNVTDIAEMAKCVEEAGADAISLINTITSMVIDIETRRPKLANITGGLSGPAIRPVAVRMVWQVAQTVKVPVIGIGGIMNASDALEFLIAGASAVQVGTANFVNPRTTIEVIEGIHQYLIEKGLSCVKDIVGTLET